MERPSIFIGSSSEGLDTARAIKQQFDHEADVDVWNEGVFKLNASYLESLLRAANLYDFAILVFTPDDLVTSRGKAQAAPRDNVIFEHGLFLGRLGPNRAFIVCEESVKILSDFAGITVATYRKRDDDNLLSAVGNACNQIRQVIRDAMNRSEINLLPSTALAIGYHENFVKKVVGALIEGKGIKKKITHVKDDGAKKIREVPVSYGHFVLRIVIPEELSYVAPDGLKQRVKHLTHISLATPFRDFPFYVRASDTEAGKLDTLELFDIPTTILSSRKAIEMILKDSYFGPNKDRDKLEKREIRNFEKTLSYLIERDYGRNPDYIKLEKTAFLEGM